MLSLTPMQTPTPPLFFQRFSEIATTYPEHVALEIDGSNCITYRDLRARVQALSRALKQAQVTAGCLVALDMAKSADYITAMLACWACGAAFMPLDPSLPAHRRKWMLQHAKPAARIDASLQIIMEPSPHAYDPSLAYILFTSGSTGAPKGVMVPHTGVVNFIDAQIALFAFTHTSRSILLLSTQFDASISDIGTALLSGATLCIESVEPLQNVPHLPALLTKRRITHVDLPPALLSVLSPEIMPPSLQTIIIGGEVCPAETVRLWASHVRLISVYGPTEATVCTSMIHARETWQHGAIGVPMAGTQYRIVADGKDDTTGELHISGAGLALGYVNEPDLTAEKFIMDHGVRYYRTGDYVRRDANGNYLFLGRIDRQIKLHGKLVAPEEIEQALMQHEAVRKAAVIAHDTVLTAYIETHRDVAEANIREWLREHIPSWMVPQRIVTGAQLPLTASGKIDHAALVSVQHEHMVDAPLSENACMASLQHQWQRVLSLHALPHVDADFFSDLGGDSIAALNAVLEAERHGFALASSAINRCRTIRQLALLLALPAVGSSHESMPAARLEREAILDEAWQEMLRHAASLPIMQNGNILLTGATGFLGAHILQTLLSDTHAEIICIIRASDVAHARARLYDACSSYRIQLTEDQRRRIHVMVGDVSHLKFGLSDAQWHDLAVQVHSIYHCAAAVNMLHTYDALYAVNVTATQEVVRLACASRQKRVHYASSLSVVVATEAMQGIWHEDAPLQPAHVYGGYAQSKWVADRFVQHCIGHGLDARIYRFGLVTGDSRSGVAAAHDYLAVLMRGLLQLGAAPTGEWQKLELDVTPVDYAVAAMCHIACHAPPRVYHICGAGRFNLGMMIQALEEIGKTIRPVPADTWSACIQPGSDASATWMALCRLLSAPMFEQFRAMDIFQATGMVFDDAHTQRALAGSGIVCPPADAALLRRYVKGLRNA